MPTNHNKNLDFQVSCRKRGDILYFQVSGDVDSQAVRIAYWQEIIVVTKQHKQRKLLVIDRKKHKPASPEELTQLIAMMRIYSHLVDRIALVEPTAQFVSAAEHAEIEGHEVGINIRVFGSVEEAERWLMHGLSGEI